MLEKISPDTINRFRLLGAVRCSHFRQKREFQGGLVYFWDSQGREIGYTSTLTPRTVVFAPYYRLWDEANLSLQVYMLLTSEERSDYDPEMPQV